jgi:pimeloyl-ACP methyl ester carboxylesterase
MLPRAILLLLVSLVSGACLTRAAEPEDRRGNFATPLSPIVTPVARDYVRHDPAFEPLPGARAFWGEYAGGTYQIEVPDEWNGDVVYYAHGYRGHQRGLVARMPRLHEHLIDSGFAVAASSYSTNGYEPGAAARDTYLLRDVFEREVGKPRRSYLYGASMGGHVIALMLERYPDAYDGALSVCGAVAGKEILDYFLSWTLLAGHFSGVELWREFSDGEAFSRAVREQVLPRLGKADALTESGERFKSAIRHLSGGGRPSFEQGFRRAYNFNFALVIDGLSNPSPANVVWQNADTEYELTQGLALNSREFNEGIVRVAPDDGYEALYPDLAPMTGKIETPFLTMFTTGDLIVPVTIEQSYRHLVDDAGSGEYLVQRAVRRAGHCAFWMSELATAFDDMVVWVTQNERPAGHDVLADLSDWGQEFTALSVPADPSLVETPGP